LIDPREAIRRLRGDQYRVDILNGLIEIATSSSADGRAALDQRIWGMLISKGIVPSMHEVNERAEFCRSAVGFDAYASLVETKLNLIKDP
jgi:hypothetical protein